MNKISKKIVALVTMAAFVLTLAPVAAFAANPVAADSTYKVEPGTNAGQLVVTVNYMNGESAADTNVGTPSVQVFVTGTTAGTTVTTTGVSNDPTTVGAVEAGVTASDYTMTFTYSGLAAGNHDVTVKMDEDGTGDDTHKYEAIDVQAGEQGSAYVSNNASVKASQIVAVDQDNEKDITVDPDADPVTVQFDVYDASGDTVSKLPLSNGSSNYTYVWATDENNQFTDGISFGGDAVATTGGGTADNYVYAVNGGAVSDDQDFTMSFVRPGTYYVYAGVSATNANSSAINGLDANTAFSDAIDIVGTPIKVTVNARNYDVETINLEGNTTGTNNTVQPVAGENDKFTWDISDDGTAANGTKVYRVTGTALQEDGTAAQYVNLNLDVNKSGLALSDEQVSTDKNGEFEFTFTVTKANIYKIDITEEGNDKTSVELTVNKDQVTASDITTVKDGGVMLAGDDDNYVASVYPTGEETLLSDAVQFEITDTNGNVVTGGSDLPDYKILVTAKPDKSTLDEENVNDTNDLSLAWDAEDEVWTLAYTNTANSVATDLIAGKYSVRVAFDNNTKAATASFTLAKFGEVQGLVFNGSDEVVLGENVTGSVSYEDEQGIRVPASDDVLITASGNALSDTTNTVAVPGFSFATKPHNIDNEAYYGSVITLTAFDSEIPSLVQKTVTVVAEDTDYSLAFDSTQGPANENNRVQVSVVDSDGDVVRTVAGETYAYVVSSSNEDAKVDVTPSDVNSGKGALTIYSDKETTLSIGVVVTDANGEAIYAGNLEYTVGKEDVNADTNVVMTIGSSDLVVNNKLVAGDAAPYVADSRTMVPIRVLTESFGAEVNYDNDARTVTIKDGDTTVVMTIGETTYTVNGEEKTMDVAPVIGSGDRAYVPVRFAAEALGYEVTPLYAADGTTASVLFQK